MAVNFTPNMEGYTGQGAFRFWCQKVLPLVYDDSLSYYELLNKVVNYLNNTISDVAAVETNVDSLLDAYNQLQDYVNNYFDNLDVQREINNKLDALAESGELSALIDPYIPGAVSDWLNEHITPTAPAIDNTLSVSGAAADAKVTGDTIREKTDAISEATINLWTVGRNVDLTTTAYKNVSLPNALPAGRYTIIATTETDYTGKNLAATLPYSSAVSCNFNANARTAVTFDTDNELTGFRFYAARTTSASGVHTVFKDIMLVAGEYSDMGYLSPVSAVDYVARNAGISANTEVNAAKGSYASLADAINTPVDNLTIRVDTLEEAAEELENTVDGIESAVEKLALKVPDYWVEHITRKTAAINRRVLESGGHGSFVFVTDIHDNNKGKSPALINYIREHSAVNRLILGGDYANDADSKDEFIVKLYNALTKFKSAGMLTNAIAGNHEYNNGGSGTAAGEARKQAGLEFSNAEVAAMMLTGQNNILNRLEAAAAFYFDDEQNKIRFYAASITAGSGGSPTSVKFIADDMQRLPDGYTVILLIHHAIGTGITILRQWDALNDILTAVRNHTDVTLTQPAPYLNAHYDYTNTNINVGFVLCGDSHADGVFAGDSVCAVRTTCDAFIDNDGYGLAANTDSEQAFDAISVDTVNGILYATRIGRGFDRIVHYNPLSVTDTATVTTTVPGAAWYSDDSDAVTVQGGVITRTGDGATIVHADGAATKEYWFVV